LGEVIDITANLPHTEGPAVCLQCKHEWHCVAPTGTMAFECPECGTMKGVFQGICMPDDVYECECGCSYCFIAGTGSVMCVNCGVTHANVLG
jgi:hypothetical protein